MYKRQAIGYAYSRQNDLLAYAAATSTAGITQGAGTGLWTITGGGVSGSTGTGHRLGGKYTFALGSGSSIGIGAMWERLNWDIQYATAVTGDLTNLKKTGWRVQGNYAFGNHFISLEYARSNKLEGSITSLAPGLRSFDGSGTQARTIILAYNYAFSKRTSLTAYYTDVRNDTNASTGALVFGAIATAAGADPKYYGLNLKHSF